jgi:AraC-like DNA-binding protein
MISSPSMAGTLPLRAVAGVPASWIRRQCAGAVSEGVSQELLFERSLIKLPHGDEADQISPAQYLLLWMNTGISIEDAAQGLGTTRFPLGHSALALRLMLGCATLEGAIHAVKKFYSMSSGAVRLELHASHDYAALSVRCEGRIETAAEVMEDTGLTFLFMCINVFLGRPMPIINVITRDPTHFNLGGRHWAMKAPVRHGPVAAIRFSKAILASRPTHQRCHNAYWDCFRPWLQFIEEDEAAVVPASEFRLNDLAKKSGVSYATLRRRLERVHGGFRPHRERALANAGIALLRDSEASVDSVAAELGYADARSFRRFLKGATGKTPIEIRRGEAAPWDTAGSSAEIHRRIRETTARLEV